MDNNTTAEDRAWFAEEVTVQVEQDNRAWLDTLLEMKQLELVNFAVYQYAIPEAAANAVGRNDLMQMIVVANKAGGGQAVSQTEYIYIPELLNVLEPAVSLFDETSQPLYLTRGSGESKQVYDKVNDKWLSLRELKRTHTANVTAQKDVARNAADTVATHPTFPQDDNATPPVVPPAPVAPAAPAKTTYSAATMSVITSGKLKRAELVEFATELDIEGTEDIEKYPTNGSIADKIKEVNEANKGE